MFSTDFIFRQQENLVDNQKCQAGFRQLCNKILFQTLSMTYLIDHNDFLHVQNPKQQYWVSWPQCQKFWPIVEHLPSYFWPLWFQERPWLSNDLSEPANGVVQSHFRGVVTMWFVFLSFEMGNVTQVQKKMTILFFTKWQFFVQNDNFLYKMMTFNSKWS